MSETKLPEGWISKMSRSRDKPYYMDIETKETQWEMPTKPAPGLRKRKRDDKSDKDISKVRVRHILAKHKDSRNPKSWRQDVITRTKEEAMEIINAHREDIISGKKKFEDIATTESDCSSAKRGGDLGFFEHHKMQKPFADASFQLKVDDVSEIVDTDSGIHIIKRIG